MKKFFTFLFAFIACTGMMNAAKMSCGAVSDLPWTEGFESVEYIYAERSIPTCWDCTDVERVYVKVDSEYEKRAHSGTKCLRFSQTDATEPIAVILQACATPIKELNIAFYYFTAVGASYGNPEVGYITTSGNFVTLATLDKTETEAYIAYELNMSAAGDDAANIAIRYVPGTGDYGWAYIDDVTISLIPECIKPTDVHETAVTSSTATVAWTANSGETAWKLQTSLNGTDWSEDIAANTNPFTLTGLTPETRYYVRVKADCGGDASDWSNADEFRTAVLAEKTWNFEDQTVNQIPAYWDNSASTATSPYLGYDVRWSVYSFGGNKMIRMANRQSQIEAGTALINTPPIELPGSPLMEMEFDYAHRADCGDMKVRISTDGGDSFSNLRSYSNPTGYPNYNDTDPGVFTTDIIDLSAYAGQTVILQFFANANAQEGAIFVDNVVIRMPAACSAPKNITFSDITASTVSVAWQEMGTATEWRIQTSLNGTDWSGDIVANTNPFTLTGLNADTEYFIRVDAYCGVSSESAWSDVTSFRTGCAAQDMPFYEDFESALSTCWNAASQWELSDEDHVSGSQSIRFTAGEPAGLILPPVTLTEEAQFIFWHKNPEVIFNVYANTVSDETNLGAFTASSEWKKESISLAAYTGQSVRLIIYGWYNSYKYLYIDDAAIDKAKEITPKSDPENPGVYYRTFYDSQVKYALPAGVEAYTAAISGTDLNLTKIAREGQTIPADNAVIFKSTVSPFNLTPSEAAPVSVDDNDLQGSDEAISAPANCYVLSGHSTDNSVTGVGFYQYSGTIPAHMAYIVYNGGAYAPKLRFVFNGAQGIESTEQSENTSRKVLENGVLYIIRGERKYNAQGIIVK